MTGGRKYGGMCIEISSAVCSTYYSGQLRQTFQLYVKGFGGGEKGGRKGRKRGRRKGTERKRQGSGKERGMGFCGLCLALSLFYSPEVYLFSFPCYLFSFFFYISFND